MNNFSVFEGDLYRNNEAKPIRLSFERTFSRIVNTAQFKATLRAGSSTDLGGYPLVLRMSDGECMCFECARDNARAIIDAIKTRSNCGWRVVGCEVHWEGEPMLCANCSKELPSTYGNPFENEEGEE